MVYIHPKIRADTSVRHMRNVVFLRFYLIIVKYWKKIIWRTTVKYLLQDRDGSNKSKLRFLLAIGSIHHLFTKAKQFHICKPNLMKRILWPVTNFLSRLN